MKSPNRVRNLLLILLAATVLAVTFRDSPKADASPAAPTGPVNGTLTLAADAGTLVPCNVVGANCVAYTVCVLDTATVWYGYGSASASLAATTGLPIPTTVCKTIAAGGPNGVSKLYVYSAAGTIDGGVRYSAGPGGGEL